MSSLIIMPQLGESVAEGSVIEWLKREGDHVEKDEAVLAISTEKVDAEIPAPAAGILSKILVKAGEVAPVGATLAIITEASASGTGIDLGTAPPISVPAPAAPVSPRPASQRPAERFYSPAVRHLAEELGVDLESVPGTGAGGRVTRGDVEQFAQTQPSREAPAAAAEHGSRPEVAPQEELIPLSKLRRTIAERMLRSKQVAPHVTSVAEADFTAVARYRDAVKADFERAQGVRLTFLPFLVKATADALKDFPTLNARWTDEGIRVRKAIHLGIAVALAEGLVVPVLRDPASLSLSAVAVALAGLIRRAQEGRLLPEELTGSTFTVNNFGADGNLMGTPILNQPEAGILGIGTIEKRPVVVSRDGEDAIAIRWMGYLCLSYDHRVVDGAVAGRFLQALRRSIESFRAGQGIWADPVLAG